MSRNRDSRFHAAEAAIKDGAMSNEKVRLDMRELLGEIRHELVKTQEYIMRTGKDPEGTHGTPSFGGTGSMHRDIGYADLKVR